MKIQSISDIITNSSSEVFCRIESENSLEAIKDLLDVVFNPWRSEWEIDPIVTLYNKNNMEYPEVYEDCPEKWIEIDMPYSKNDVLTFYESGLEALLKEAFGTDFKINYNVV